MASLPVVQSCRLHRAILALVSAACLAASATSQVAWSMRDFDTNRTSANTSETTLNVNNVNTSTFGQLFTRPADGQIYAQPLVVPGVVIPGRGKTDVVYVCTMHDSVYAYDATNASNSTPIWHRSFINPTRNITSIPYYFLTGATDIHPEVGIVSTPALDIPNGSLYVVVRTLEGDPSVEANYHQRLHMLDMTTGADKIGPVELRGSFPGTGDETSNGRVYYSGMHENQRSGLVLANGKLYICSASHGDNRPYHGWVLLFDPKTLKLLNVFCTTPNGGLGGFWMAGHAVPVDSAGNLYPVSGNGDFDGKGEWGDSLLKLDGTTLKVLDYFTPYNQQDLDNWDSDYGSCGSILIPGANLVVSGGKQGKLFVTNTQNLGKYNPNNFDNQVVQWWQACNGEILGTPVYWNGPAGNKNLYVWSENDLLQGFHFTGSVFQTDAFATGPNTDYAPVQGAYLSISSNGTATNSAIVWANVPASGDPNPDTVPGMIRAYRATDLTEIWNSLDVPGDDIGLFAKFCPPVIANGKVYVPTFSNQLVVFGLLPPLPPSAPTALTAQAGDGAVGLQWNAPRAASSFEIRRGPLSGPFVKIATSTTSNYIDSTVTDGTTYGYVVVAQNKFGNSPTSNLASATPAPQTGGTGAGIPAVYYNDPINGNTHFITPAVSEVDPTINFYWQANAPVPGVQQTNFSVIWSGEVVAPTTGFYTFQTISDDGNRLWFNNALVCNGWVDQAATSYYSPTILMMAGKHYPIQMEMYQDQGYSAAVLLWSGPGTGGFQVVPATALFAPSTPPVPQWGVLDLTTAFSIDGISGISNPGDGNIGNRQTLAGELLPPLLTAQASSSSFANFLIGPKYDQANNIVACDGSTILVPAVNDASVQVLGLSIAGSQPVQFVMNYSDGSTDTDSVTVSDWNAPAQNGEVTAATYPRRHSPAGFVNRSTSLFWYTLPTSTTKRLISITLPTNTSVKILGITEGSRTTP